MTGGVAGRSVVGPLLSVSLLFCGCAGQDTSNLPSASVLHSLRLPHASTRNVRRDGSIIGQWLYTAQLYGEDLGVYRRDGLSVTFVKRLKKGVSSPRGTKATPDGWWYVANAGHFNVLVYRSTSHGPEGPVATLDDYGEVPSNVDVTPTRRLVAVSNYSTVGKGAGSVSIYLNRQAVPTRTLRYGRDPLQGTGVAIDSLSDCYWAFNDPNTGTGSIVKFTRCAERGSVVVSTIASAAGITFDRSDNLYYIDQTRGIYKCAHTSDCDLFATGFGVPVNINFDLKDKFLWVADATGYIDAVDPVSGDILFQTPASGGPTDPPFGIAPAPGG